jgi:hypothetical protein
MRHVLWLKKGNPVAAVISTKDYQRPTQLEQQRAERFDVLDEVGEAFRDFPVEGIEHNVAQAILKIRSHSRRWNKGSAHEGSDPGGS